MTPTYLAGRVTARRRLRRVKRELVKLGYAVSSTWLTVAKDYGDPACTALHMELEARRDVEEVSAASFMFIDTIDESTTGGRSVELGLHIARGRPFVRVGPVRNIFDAMAVRSYRGWRSCLRDLRRNRGKVLPCEPTSTTTRTPTRSATRRRA